MLCANPVTSSTDESNKQEQLSEQNAFIGIPLSVRIYCGCGIGSAELRCEIAISIPNITKQVINDQPP